ncbi:MAG: PorV/PorQ family protein [Melioribacteraceae bacterium]
MKTNRIKIILLLLIITGYNVYAQVGLNKLAQSTMNFLLVSISPKASAMGEAFYAVGNSSEAILYNPAGIANTNNTIDISLNYTQWIADIKYLAGTATYNLNNYGVIGFHILTVDYGDIIGTSLIDPSQQALYPDGYIDNGKLSNVGAYSVGLSYAKRISTQFSIGGNIRIAGQNLGENYFINGTSKKNNAAKLVFDAGVLYNTGYKDFRFGMAIRNFSSNIKREEIDEQLPLVFTLGTAINLWKFVDASNTNNELTLAVDFAHFNNYSERMNLGLEYKFMNMISLRAGYQTNRDIASWSAGIGLNTEIAGNLVEINYSYSHIKVFNNVNRISLNFAL